MLHRTSLQRPVPVPAGRKSATALNYDVNVLVGRSRRPPQRVENLIQFDNWFHLAPPWPTNLRSRLLMRA